MNGSFHTVSGPDRQVLVFCLAHPHSEISMKSFLRSTGAAVALFVAFTGQAFALPVFDTPEPGSIGLVTAGLVAAVYFLRKGKKK
jgi:hypothetical protein